LPVTIEQARFNSRIDCCDFDDQLNLDIAAATKWIQEQTEAALITSTWLWTFDRFPRKTKWLSLPMWPVQSIVKIEYRNESDVWTEIESAKIVLRKNNGRARVALKGWEAWPFAKFTPDAVRVEFVAGFGDESTDVPHIWQRAILLLVTHWFENPQAAQTGTEFRTIPFGVESIIENLRDPDDAEDFDLE
jgi:uncharacterized phiE125 gp8 family phage protein